MEILVTLVIIAIGSAVAVVAWRGDPRSDPAREARVLAGALEYAATRAQARQETLGVSAIDGGHRWRFWIRDDTARWTTVVHDDVLDEHALGASLTLAPLGYAGQPLAADSVVPLRATGRNEPFSFVLGDSAQQWVVAMDPLNRATITAAPAP